MALALLTTMSMPPNRAAVCVERGFHRRLVAHVDRERQRAAAFLGDQRGGGVDGAFELGMRIDCLGGNGDIGAVGGGLERDRQPDAARAAGDEQRFALERHCILALSAYSAVIARESGNPVITALSVFTGPRSRGRDEKPTLRRPYSLRRGYAVFPFLSPAQCEGDGAPSGATFLSARAISRHVAPFGAPSRRSHLRRRAALSSASRVVLPSVRKDAPQEGRGLRASAQTVARLRRQPSSSQGPQ